MGILLRSVKILACYTLKVVSVNDSVSVSIFTAPYPMQTGCDIVESNMKQNAQGTGLIILHVPHLISDD